jgi:hypothetical protein
MLILVVYRAAGAESETVPHLSPVSGGGIQIDWDTPRRSLEAEILPDGRIQYLAIEDDRVVGEDEADVSEMARQFLWLHRS